MSRTKYHAYRVETRGNLCTELGGPVACLEQNGVTQSCSFDDALCIFSNVTRINEKTKGMFKFIA